MQLRLNGEKLEELLSERAVQFRAIQRRLLTRFKDKTPAPLQHLDTLLDGTYKQASTMPVVVPLSRSVDFENQVCFFRVSFPRGKKNSYYVNLSNCTWQYICCLKSSRLFEKSVAAEGHSGRNTGLFSIRRGKYSPCCYRDSAPQCTWECGARGSPKRHECLPCRSGYVAPPRPDGSLVHTSLFRALFVWFIFHCFLFPSSSWASLCGLVSLLLRPPAMPTTLGLQVGWVSSLMRLCLFVDTVAGGCLKAFDEDAWFSAFHLFQRARLPCL